MDKKAFVEKWGPRSITLEVLSELFDDCQKTITTEREARLRIFMSAVGENPDAPIHSSIKSGDASVYQRRVLFGTGSGRKFTFNPISIGSLEVTQGAYFEARSTDVPISIHEKIIVLSHRDVIELSEARLKYPIITGGSGDDPYIDDVIESLRVRNHLQLTENIHSNMDFPKSIRNRKVSRFNKFPIINNRLQITQPHYPTSNDCPEFLSSETWGMIFRVLKAPASRSEFRFRLQDGTHMFGVGTELGTVIGPIEMSSTTTS